MNWQEIIFTIISVVLTAFVSWAADRLIKYINQNIADSKFSKFLTDAVGIVTRSVKTVYQTYVESLKGKDMFTKEAQKEALIKASDMAMEQLTEESRTWIAENFGDVKAWITSTIESVIYDLKKKSAVDKA